MNKNPWLELLKLLFDWLTKYKRLSSPFVFINDGQFRYFPAQRAMVEEWDDFHDDMVSGDFNGDGFVDIATIKRISGQPELELILHLWIVDESWHALVTKTKK